MARACMTSSVPRVYACSWGARIFQRNRLRCVDCFTCAPKSRRWLVTGTWSGSRASRDRREHSQPSSMAIGRESSSSLVEWCTRDHRRLHTRNSHYCLRRDRSSRTHPIEARQSRSKRTASTVGICRHPGCLRAIGRTCTSSDVDPPPPSHLWEQRCRLGSSRSAPEPNPLSKSPLVMSRGNIAAQPRPLLLSPAARTCGERPRRVSLTTSFSDTQP